MTSTPAGMSPVQGLRLRCDFRLCALPPYTNRWHGGDAFPGNSLHPVIFRPCYLRWQTRLYPLFFSPGYEKATLLSCKRRGREVNPVPATPDCHRAVFAQLQSVGQLVALITLDAFERAER